jgi:voltage-gated potassium channel
MEAVQRRLQIFLALFLLVATIGTLGFMHLENLSFAEAFYYNIVTMSTVGYGDIHPTSQASRMFAILLIVMGGATFLGVIANATELLLVKRDTQSRMRKVNMVLGFFFSEVGDWLLALLLDCDDSIDTIRVHLLVKVQWKHDDFTKKLKILKNHDFKINIDKADLPPIHSFLNSKRTLLVSLLENPVLIENESFSEALLAVFHLADELGCRQSFDNLPETDLNHLTGDMNRAYQRLVEQWLFYLQHLKGQYPYLFSLAIRKNPFDPDADPVVVQ